MGFGSYDESEQEKQDVDTDEVGGESVLKGENADHNGSVSFEDNDTDEMLKAFEEKVKDE